MRVCAFSHLPPTPSFPPSSGSGDWGLARQGAIFVTDADRVLIANSTFTRLDGNAVFLSGRTRNVSVVRNHFSFLGESAVASWGFANGVDATAGLQPWGTTVEENICREIGHYEKQVSCYFAAVTAGATIERNIMFNMPRAAVNYNDDMAGGSLLTRNLIWNTCRESQDHGPCEALRAPARCLRNRDGDNPPHPTRTP